MKFYKFMSAAVLGYGSREVKSRKLNTQSEDY